MSKIVGWLKSMPWGGVLAGAGNLAVVAVVGLVVAQQRGCSVVPAPKPTPPAPPAAITLTVDAPQPAGYARRITAQTKGKNVRWFVVGPDPTPKLLDVPPHAVDFSSPIKGTYKVWASTAIGESAETAELEFPNGGDSPTPPGPGPTPPTPNPPVPPAPAPGAKLFVSVFDDAATRTPATAAILDSQPLRKSLAEAGHKFRSFDAKSAQAQTFAKYIQQAGGCPALILQTAGDGKVAASVRLPASDQAILDQVKKVVGP